MKKILTNNIVENVRKQPFSKGSIDHLQEALLEITTSIIKQFTENTSNYFKLNGLNDSDPSSTSWNISAGSVYYNGEVYQVDAFSGSHGSNVPVLTFATTYKSGDPVRFSDSNEYDVHEIRKMVISMAASGSGNVDYSALQSIGQGWVTTERIAGSAVTSAEIADGAVNTNELANDSVNNSKIANNAVNSAKIANGNVTKSADGGQRYTAKFPIPSWDMQTDVTKNVAIDGSIDITKIVGLEVWIHSDSASTASPLDSDTGGSAPNGGVQAVTTGNVNCYRRTGGFYDANAYNDPLVSRGHILVTYEV